MTLFVLEMRKRREKKSINRSVQKREKLINKVPFPFSRSIELFRFSLTSRLTCFTRRKFKAKKGNKKKLKSQEFPLNV